MSDSIPVSRVQIPDRLDGQFFVQVELSGSPPDDIDVDLNETVESWLEFGARGAFCVPQIPPDQAAMALKEFRRPSELTRQWLFEASRCDPRCLRVLYNLLVGFSLDAHPLLTITIVGAGSAVMAARPLEAVTFENQSVLYPDASSALGFPVEWEPTGSPRSYRRLLVEFAAPPSEATVEAIATLMGKWERISVDGFPMTEEDLESGKCAIEDIAIHLFDEFSVEVVVAEFGGSEEAWNPLLNALGSFHRTSQPIARIKIE
ncbi:hypothetical protein MesoLjLc_53700 [Mesorhizobium sp. L-8-10]|uniref:hypothetical protein n=1 Tax=Mesorhizobium sp. L-8-10 TaxID=2744523 RepID=UPI0019282F3F|nr:hypothetical protein [Mesorhizobium sp. L-8-10]BCH33440.1 hypothetical protein MesoLjLc_53700 [Mesorhizobium sp. L-8-10]